MFEWGAIGDSIFRLLLTRPICPLPCMGVGHLDVPCSLGGAEKEASGEAWFDIISWFRDGGSLLSTVDFQPLNWSTNCARTSEMLFTLS
jgi:hypothetical protein